MAFDAKNDTVASELSTFSKKNTIIKVFCVAVNLLVPIFGTYMREMADTYEQTNRQTHRTAALTSAAHVHRGLLTLQS